MNMFGMFSFKTIFGMFSLKTRRTDVPTIDISDSDLKFLRELSHEIKTQNNHCTAHPYYYVVRTWRDFVAPAGFGDRQVLVDWNGGDPQTFADEKHARKYYRDLELTDEESAKRLEKLEQYGMYELPQYENVFFTQKGYEEHMRLNGHNYRPPYSRDPGFFVMHAFRNPEIKTLLDIVHKLGGQNGGDNQAGSSDTGGT
jgi:hypothetical protein